LAVQGEDVRSEVRTVRVAIPEGVGLRSDVGIRHFQIVSDEPLKMGGSDAGPTPMELVLAGVASCVHVTLRLVAAERGVDLGRVAIAFEGDIDRRGLFGTADVRPDFLSVRGEISAEADDATLASLAETVARRSPALSLLTRAGVALELAWRGLGTASREGEA